MELFNRFSQQKKKKIIDLKAGVNDIVQSRNKDKTVETVQLNKLEVLDDLEEMLDAIQRSDLIGNRDSRIIRVQAIREKVDGAVIGPGMELTWKYGAAIPSPTIILYFRDQTNEIGVIAGPFYARTLQYSRFNRKVSWDSEDRWKNTIKQELLEAIKRRHYFASASVERKALRS